MYNLIRTTAGAGVMLSSDNVVNDNCMTNNSRAAALGYSYVDQSL